MLSYDIFFFGIVFFFIGVLTASFGTGYPVILTFTALLAAIFLLWNILKPKNLSEKISRSPDGLGLSRSESRRGEGKENFAAGAKLFWFLKASFLVESRFLCLAILTMFILLGAGYYKWDDSKFRDIKIDFNKTINFSGLVVGDPQYSFNTQTLMIKLDEPYKGKIQVKLRLYPQYHYGDKISFKGKIEKPPLGSYANYLAKEGISGLANFPDARLEKSNLGSSVLSALFKFKNSVIDSYQKVLSPKQAALLAGLTFGERGNLDKDFKQAMSLSGTTHLTALSGKNITIIVIAISTALGFLFPQFFTFIITMLVILVFVAMTGFDPSVVRAMIMGFAVLVAKLVGRIYDPRNSIALAAFLITLFNPKSLVFDVGFQLSFLAVLGIIYLRPALKKILRFGDKPGFLAWRENLLMTLSAQLATAPVLITAFGSFSLLAFCANILILLLIPLTMSLGFFMGLLGFVSHYLALIVGFLTSLFLNYEIFIINLFAEISLPINSNLGFFAIFSYYLLLLGIVVFTKLKA